MAPRCVSEQLSYVMNLGSKYDNNIVSEHFKITIYRDKLNASIRRKIDRIFARYMSKVKVVRERDYER